MKTELEQAKEWWNREGFNGSLYQKELGEKYNPSGFNDFDENVLHIWKKETQEYNESFNPDAHSSLIIDFDAVETIEDAAKRQWGNVHRSGVLGFIEGAKSEASRNYWFKIFQEEQNKQEKL